MVEKMIILLYISIWPEFYILQFINFYANLNKAAFPGRFMARALHFFDLEKSVLNS